ncbi:MAG TPA: hypothetical protein VHO47_00430 [Candidatus Babeliales bacterium]|nr:hypothetical protein [Candidatus Babeliales bacterium]
MKKLLSFFILASCLIQGIAQAAVTQYSTFDEVAAALQKAKDSNNPEQAQMVLDRLGTWRGNRAFTRLIQDVTQIAGTQAPIIPVVPVRGGLSQDVRNAAAAVKTAVAAVQDAGKNLSQVEKTEVNGLAGIPDLLK